MGFNFFEHIPDSPPVEAFSDYYSHDHYIGEFMPIEIQQFGIALMTMMEGKPLDNQKALDYVSKFLTTFCNDRLLYGNLTTEGKSIISSLYHSENEFVKKAVVGVDCTVIDTKVEG